MKIGSLSLLALGVVGLLTSFAVSGIHLWRLDLCSFEFLPLFVRSVVQTFPLLNIRRNFAYSDIPDLSGRLALVTGGNSGLGFETAKALAERGAEVIIACRSEERGLEAIEKINVGKDLKLSLLKVDISSLESIDKALNDFRPSRLDMLVLNAGKISDVLERNDLGLEWMLGTMHVGHFYFTSKLMAVLKTTANMTGDVRVVVVSSAGHLATLQDVSGVPDFNTSAYVEPSDIGSRSQIMTRYGMSKLANVLFARELHNRYGHLGVYVNSLHPGAVSTDLNSVMKWIPVGIFYSAEEAALTQIFLAANGTVPKDKYYYPVASEGIWGVDTSKHTLNSSLARDLWQWTEETVRHYYDSGFHFEH